MHIKFFTLLLSTLLFVSLFPLTIYAGDPPCMVSGLGCGSEYNVYVAQKKIMVNFIIGAGTIIVIGLLFLLKRFGIISKTVLKGAVVIILALLIILLLINKDIKYF